MMPDEIDTEGANVTASALLDNHHDIVGVSDFGDDTSDRCAACGFATGWVYPVRQMDRTGTTDRFGHATQASSDEVRSWIAGNSRHLRPPFGLPYARAGVDVDGATATCPVCGFVSHGKTPKQAAAGYARHFAEKAEHDA